MGYFNLSLSISKLHVWRAWCIRLWKLLVGKFFKCVMWFSWVKVFIFCSNASFWIMAITLFLSALTIVRLFLCKMSLTWLMLYWYLLYSVLCTFDARISLILVAARYRIGLFILVSSCLMALSVSNMSSLIYMFSYGIVGSQC